MTYQNVPAARQASILYHQRMKVAFDARGHKDVAVDAYLRALDQKLEALRAKLGVVPKGYYGRYIP